LAGVLAAVAATLGAQWLFRATRRPGLGLALFAVSVVIDLFCGRVTFALGFAGAVVSLSLLRQHHSGWACVAGTLGFLASPLAGLFLGLAALTVAIVDPLRRRGAIALAAVLGGLALVLAVMSPEVGRMPFPWWHLALVLLITGVVAAICPQRYVRCGSALVAAAAVVFFVVPGAVGTNIDRIVWIAAAPVAVACADLSRLRMVVITLGLLTWPAIDLSIQLVDATAPTTSASFYKPLTQALREQQAQVGPAGLGERVEVVDPATQWSAAYVAPGFTLARGWDRQLDRADDALFYDGTLNPTTYHQWLSALAVGWVAVPRRGALDYASVDEAALVRSGTSYLKPVWQNADWQLYRVRAAQPLIQGATLTSVGPDGVTFHAAKAGTVDLQLRWSRYLTLAQGASVIPSCITQRGQWTSIQIEQPGTYRLAGRFALDSSADATCAAA
jgi:hypothetical protein